MSKDASLKKKTLKAGFWLFFRKFAVRLINLGAIYVLARKLSPSDFGVVALARVALRLITDGTSQTTSTFIIYDNQEDWKERVNTGFWLNVILLILLFIILLIILPFIVKFYKGGIFLKRIVLWFFVAFVFTELRSIPDALLKKKLLYNKLVLKDTIMDGLSAIISVFMAIYGYGVWSLVTPFVIVSILNLPVSFFQSKWFPDKISLKGAGRIIKYTVHIIGTNILTFLSNEGDTLIVGKLLGFRDLGIYNRAYASANLIVSNIKSVATDVSFPSLSSVNRDIKRLHRAFIKMLELLSVVAFPLTIGLIVLAREFILVLYGQQWIQSVVPMQILAIMALRRVVGSPAGTLFNAKGKPDIMLKFGIVFTPLYLISVFFGALHGMIGVALSVTIVRTTGGLFIFYLVSRELEYSLFKLFSHMIRPFIYASFMGIVIYIAKKVFCISNVYISLFLYTAVGMLIYGILIFMDKKTRNMIFELLKSLR